jgi:hypothetical protein
MSAQRARVPSASVRARLLNLARQRGEDFQITLRNSAAFQGEAAADSRLLLGPFLGIPGIRNGLPN